MKLLDTGHALFRPFWIRLGIVTFAFAWAAFEASMGETVWALVFGAIASYCAWTLLFSYRTSREKDARDG